MYLLMIPEYRHEIESSYRHRRADEDGFLCAVSVGFKIRFAHRPGRSITRARDRVHGDKYRVGRGLGGS